MHGFGKFGSILILALAVIEGDTRPLVLCVIDMDKLSRQTHKSKGHGDGGAEPEVSISISNSNSSPDDHIENTHSGSSSSAAYSNSDSQPEGYDPNRIPASIFGNRPANPGEWSVASNESLFSLHIANGSLSRENFLMLYKSGELGRLDEPAVVIKPGNFLKPPHEPEPEPEPEANKLPRSNAQDQDQAQENSRTSSHFHPCLPPVAEADHIMDKISEQTEKHLNLTDHAANPQATSPSADSVNSNKSFAFPVFERDEVTNRSINMKIATAESEKQQQATSEPQIQEPQSEKRLQPEKPKTSPKPGGGSSSSWFSCFPCFSQHHGK